MKMPLPLPLLNVNEPLETSMPTAKVPTLAILSYDKMTEVIVHANLAGVGGTRPEFVYGLDTGLC